MATRKGVELRTDFTGSDKNFKPVLDRTRRGVRNLGKEAKKAGTDGAKGLDKLKLKLTQIKEKAGKAKIAIAAIGAGVAGVTKANEAARNDLQLSQMANMDVERFQKLAFVLKGFRIEADETADILKELKNVTQEAIDDPKSGKASAFKMLQIDAEKFAKLDPIGKLQALADAQKRLDSDRTTRAFDEAIGDMGFRIAPLLNLTSQEFIKRLNEAPAVPEAILKKQAEQFEGARQIKGETITTGRKTFGMAAGGNLFDELKKQTFKPLGAQSPFDPSIKFDPEGEKKAEEVAKETEKFEKLLNKINKPNAPLTLMGLTVDGKSMRPVQNKMLTVMEKLAALNAKQFKIESDTFDLFQQELKTTAQ